MGCACRWVVFGRIFVRDVLQRFNVFLWSIEFLFTDMVVHLTQVVLEK